jgi:hypothetical protein
MATSLSKPSRSQWKQLIFPSAVSLLIFGGIVYLFSTHKSDEELQRESVCKNWGYDDDQSLAKCRQSQAGVDAVIAPKFQRAKLKTITDFDQELASSAQNRIMANEVDYKTAGIGEIAKAVGGSMGFGGKNDAGLEGQKFKLTGRIVTETPDQSDPDPDRTWEPQSYELWGSIPKAKNVMPDIVRLDIESLNRDERKFVQDHCEMVSFTRCDAVVLGHVGTVSEDKDIHLRYRGIIADEVVISPINVKDATN